MWTCTKCHSHRDDLDESCSCCGQPRAVETDGRPVIRCLVGAVSANGGHVLLCPGEVSLEEAVSWHQTGWIVLVDPQDEADLAAWHHNRQAGGD